MTAFHQLFGNAPVALAILGSNGRFLRTNGHYVNLFGYSLEEIPTIEDWWRSACPNPSRRERAMAAWKETILTIQAAGCPCNGIEHEVTCKDGQIRFVAISASLIGEDILAAFQDVSAQKRAEAFLRRSEERHRLLVENLPLGITIMDRYHNIVYTNKIKADYFNKRPDWFLGRKCHHEYEGQDFPCAHCPGTRAMADGESHEVVVQIDKPDGRSSWFHNRAFRYCNEQGEVEGFVELTEDITARKKAEEALRISEERLSYALQGSNEGLWDWNLETDEAYLSPRWMEMLGYGPNELPQRVQTWMSLLHPEDVERAQAHTEACLSGLQPRYEIEFRLRHKTGRWVPILSRAVIARDRHGQPLVPRRLVGTHMDMSGYKAMENALYASEARYRKVFECNPAAILIFSPQSWHFVECNPAAVAMLRIPDIEVLRTIGPEDISPERQPDGSLSRDQTRERIEAALRDGNCFFEWRHKRLDGEEFPSLTSLIPIELEGRVFLQATIHDHTEQKRAEDEQEKLRQQLHQARKMESIGRLAGGVAHDFNNMLGVILGYSELALGQLQPTQSLHADLREIHLAARRSSELTQQLLAFARKQTVSPKVLDLNATVEGMLNMLRRLIGEDIDVAWRPGKDSPQVRVDPSQLDQILFNLCANARDAIRDIGKITIETGCQVLDGPYCATNVDLVPGNYAVLSVSDNGCGMSQEIMAYLFEPFFTTKEIGRGTGLGLATVYGIVKQNHGHITVSSDPGQGSTFKVYLPRYETEATTEHKDAAVLPTVSGRKVILLVEDEPMLLEMAARMLGLLGHTVLTATTPGEAVRLAEEHAGQIDLLMTDVVMPEMNGRRLAELLQSSYPGLACLFMSGYTANVIVDHGVLEEGVAFLHKPFTLQELAEKIGGVVG